MRITYSPTFLRHYHKLELALQECAEAKENIFQQNPFDSRLKTHKLHGRLNNLWAFSVTAKIRIVFEFEEKQTVIFHAVGTHDIYK